MSALASTGMAREHTHGRRPIKLRPTELSVKWGAATRSCARISRALNPPPRAPARLLGDLPLPAPLHRRGEGAPAGLLRLRRPRRRRAAHPLDPRAGRQLHALGARGAAARARAPRVRAEPARLRRLLQ